MISFYKYLKLTFKLNNGFGGLTILNHRKVYKEWIIQLKSEKQPLDLELPWITVASKNYINSYLKNNKKTDTKIFEYGSGGSTLFFLEKACEVVSIEHDENWYNRVREFISQRNIKGWELKLLMPDVIEENQISLQRLPENPDDYYTDDQNFKFHTFKNYASYIDKFQNNYFDIVLVDGRSRPSCIKHSLNKVKIGGLLILDNAEREYYLSHNIIEKKSFELIFSLYGALICYDQFTQTNIYKKIAL